MTMDDSYSYKKVTVIVEDEDGSKSIFEATRVRNVETNEWSEPVMTLGLRDYLTTTINLGITFKADFDETTGRTYTLRREPAVDPVMAAAEAREARWSEFIEKYDSPTRVAIIEVGPRHPDHPDHEHEDCCK